MLFSELKQSLQNGIMPIYLLQGEDSFLQRTALAMLKKHSLLEPDINLTTFSGKDLKDGFSSLVSAVRSFPFISEKRFVVINEFYPTQKDLKSKDLISVLSGENDTTVVIIINEKASPSLSKMQSITVVNCSKPSEAFVLNYIKSLAQKSGVTITQDGIETLVNYTAGDLIKINSEFKKLICYAHPSTSITKANVEDICIKDTDYQIYMLTDFIAKCEFDSAYAVLTDMLYKNQDKHRLFASIYYHFRQLLHILISKQTDGVLAQALSVPEFVIRKSKAQAKKFTPKRLKSICDKLSAFDTAFKSGEISIDSALWNSVFTAMIS